MRRDTRPAPTAPPVRGRVATALLLGLALASLLPAGRAGASDVPASREAVRGHARARFPLGLHLAPAGDPAQDAAARAAVEAWNRVFADAFGVPAFGWRETEDGAAVLVGFTESPGGRLLGETRLSADGGSAFLLLPVRVTIARPRARGQTPAETVLFQVVAHELGHALGLPHANEPTSLMCCDPGALDLSDPATRAAYVAARRHPDVGSVLAQLRAHYRRVWEAPE